LFVHVPPRLASTRRRLVPRAPRRVLPRHHPQRRLELAERRQPFGIVRARVHRRRRVRAADPLAPRARDVEIRVASHVVVPIDLERVVTRVVERVVERVDVGVGARDRVSVVGARSAAARAHDGRASRDGASRAPRVR
jgi:hypothetical protein